MHKMNESQQTKLPMCAVRARKNINESMAYLKGKEMQQETIFYTLYVACNSVCLVCLGLLAQESRHELVHRNSLSWL